MAQVYCWQLTKAKHGPRIVHRVIYAIHYGNINANKEKNIGKKLPEKRKTLFEGIRLISSLLNMVYIHAVDNPYYTGEHIKAYHL